MPHKHKEVVKRYTFDSFGYVAYVGDDKDQRVRPLEVRIPEPLWLELGKPEHLSITVTA